MEPPTYSFIGMKEKNGFRYRAYVRNDGVEVQLTRQQVSRLKGLGRIIKR